ncbi:MAG: flippase-like domain-containing protein [Spirochaetes bacterium]|nr:flippase-like domain-containing protein [Spirochaetota bacterium]
MPVETRETPQSADAILQERKKRIFTLRTLLLLALSLSLAWFLIRQVDVSRAMETVRNADLLLIAACVCTYFVSTFFKMLRNRTMLGDLGIPLFDLFAITSYHSFLNQIMPARTGELTFVYYLKKIGKGEISRGLHVLVVTRIFDFIVISAFFICSIIIYFGRNTSIVLVALGAAFFAASVVGLFNLKWIVIWSGKLLHLLYARTPLGRSDLAGKVIDKIDVVVGEFSSFRTGRYAPQLAFTSILTWTALYFLFYLSIRSLGIEIGFVQSVAGSTGGVLTNVLPINSFGSFGTLEAGWTGGFVLVGMNEHDAIVTGFAYHLISFLASALVAGFCAAVRAIATRLPGR